MAHVYHHCARHISLFTFHYRALLFKRLLGAYALSLHTCRRRLGQFISLKFRKFLYPRGVFTLYLSSNSRCLRAIYLFLTLYILLTFFVVYLFSFLFITFVFIFNVYCRKAVLILHGLHFSVFAVTFLCGHIASFYSIHMPPPTISILFTFTLAFTCFCCFSHVFFYCSCTLQPLEIFILLFYPLFLCAFLLFFRELLYHFQLHNSLDKFCRLAIGDF